MTAPDLPALLARCESAGEPLPRLEAKTLVDACGFDPDAAYLLGVAIADGPLSATGYAVAFFEAVLPGWKLQLLKTENGAWFASVASDTGFAGSPLMLTPALAIICATLKALIAKGESDANS